MVTAPALTMSAMTVSSGVLPPPSELLAWMVGAGAGEAGAPAQSTIRPFDADTLRATLNHPDVVLVEPYLTGTSVPFVTEALRDIPHRVLALGVGRQELRRYGTPAEHIAAHGLDAASLRARIADFLAAKPVVRTP